MEADEEMLLLSDLANNQEAQNIEVKMDVDQSCSSEDISLATLQSAAIFDTEIEFDSESNTEPSVVKRTMEEEQDLTNKFLTGQLTFSEFAAQYGENSFEEQPAEEEEPEPAQEQRDFEKSLAEIKETSSKKKPRGQVKRQNTLPPALKGLMGEANLRFARGEHENAIKMCFEVIRQFPWAPEPFETLASLYDEKGDTEKSLQVSLLAAHLNPQASKHLWVNLAERSEDRENFKQAVTCYSKAIKADKKDFELHMKLAGLFEKLGDSTSALKTYLRLLRCVEPHHGENLIEVAKMLTQRYHEAGKLDKAKEALQITFDKRPDLITSELVNIMLEVLIGLNDLKTSVEVLQRFCNIEIITEDHDDKFILLKCSVPETLEVDIFAKLVIIIINLKAFHLLNTFLIRIKNMDPEIAGDVYFDVAEALIAEKKFTEALELLTPLTESNNFNLPAIWLRMAECLKSINRLEDSVKAYMIVVERAPQLLGARMAVGELLTSLGRKDQAIEVLTQDEDCETLNTALIYERCLLLKDVPEQKEQFIAVVQLFLSRHFVHINNKEELNALTTLRSDRKRAVLKENKNFQKVFSQGDELSGEFSQKFNEPPLEEEWQIFWYICELCLERKKFYTLQRLAFSAQGSQKFLPKYSQEIDLLCLSACYHNSDAYFGYNMVRALVMKNINCERSWNMFNMMILRADDSRHNRFLMRLLIRNPHHKALTILHANNCLVAGTYKYALSDYTSVFQKDNSAIMAFLIGVTLCQMACQKFSAKKHSLVTQAVAFFWKYKQLRGKEGLQESHYNIGRAFHQLGLLPSAIHHYKQALELDNKFSDTWKHLDLKKEAAFNLHLIYLSSGSKDIARMYLEKYIVI